MKVRIQMARLIFFYLEKQDKDHDFQKVECFIPNLENACVFRAADHESVILNNSRGWIQSLSYEFNLK